MKKPAVLLAVLLILALASAGYAADLQAGWYARMYSVQYYVYDYSGTPQLVCGGEFQTTTGQYGPFTVTDAPFYWSHSREVDVVNSVQGATATANLVLPVTAGLSTDQRLAYIEFGWQTNYDASQMRLEFWHTRTDNSTELLWQQSLGGARLDYSDTAYDLSYEHGFFFKVAVVPEPASLLTLALGIAGSVICISKRGQR